MRPFSRLERKGVCLGLLWGILSIGSWPVSTWWTGCLQAPYKICEHLWLRFGGSALARWPYVAAILLATGGLYLVAYALYLLWLRPVSRYKRRPRSLAQGRARRY
ncbi:MAG: hypothetical protein GX033_09490 [Firmicutes bacterium]|nr:hypothetical protein [Bacillota bacterium]